MSDEPGFDYDSRKPLLYNDSFHNMEIRLGDLYEVAILNYRLIEFLLFAAI
jgi:hypothetical protein